MRKRSLSMPSTTIRIDSDTYRRLLEAKAKLELATGKRQSFSSTVAFLLTLQAPAALIEG